MKAVQFRAQGIIIFANAQMSVVSFDLDWLTDGKDKLVE
jgi:hypothetical protein